MLLLLPLFRILKPEDKEDTQLIEQEKENSQHEMMLEDLREINKKMKELSCMQKIVSVFEKFTSVFRTRSTNT